MKKLIKRVLSLIMCAILITNISASRGQAAGSSRLKVQFYNAKTDLNIQINAFFRLVNTSGSAIPLKDVKMRYYYTLNSNPVNQEIGYWHPFNEGDVTFNFVKMSTPLPTADYYLEIGFTSAAGNIVPGQEIIVNTWFNKAGWENTYDQSDDYSMSPVATEYEDWNRTTAYISGVLEWGIEPDINSKPYIAPPPVIIDGQEVPIQVDASANVHEINPNIYGMAFADKDLLTSLNIPINRSGGNAQTNYNWKTDSTNRGSDWYFESLPNDNESPAQLPNGSSTDMFYEDNHSANSQTMLTIPMIGYVAKDRERRASFSIQKYGAQQSRDSVWFPDAGNGIRTDGSYITNNDPLDAYMAVDESYMAQWVSHLKNRYGSASNGGVKYYLLDNEPNLWFATHRDVVKNAPHDDELIAKSIKYSTAIKNVDSTALVAGYEDWGWLALRLSPYDFQYASTTNNWSSFPDQKAHNYTFFAEYYLKKMKEAEITSGRRLLDIFTTHIYPQGGEYSNDESKLMRELRMRSTRQLWDKNYTDESWQQENIYLIPRMKEWVDKYYPGTKIGITEYNWGSLDYPDGGIAQADILGIFGREGLDYGTLWTSVDPGTPGFNAFKIFRNYDGQNSTFGNISIGCTVPNPDKLSAFASIDSKDGSMKIVLLNKLSDTNSPVNISLANFAASNTAEIFQWTGKGQVNKLNNLSLSGNNVKTTLPPYSATIIVVKPSTTVLKEDVNSDHKIDILDLAEVSKLYNVRSSNSNWKGTCDMNSDGIINILDLVIIGRKFQ